MPYLVNRLISPGWGIFYSIFVFVITRLLTNVYSAMVYSHTMYSGAYSDMVYSLMIYSDTKCYLVCSPFSFVNLRKFRKAKQKMFPCF